MTPKGARKMGDQDTVTRSECHARHVGEQARMDRVEGELTSVAGDMKTITGRMTKIAVDFADMRGEMRGRGEATGEAVARSGVWAKWGSTIIGGIAVGVSVVAVVLSLKGCA